MPSVDLSVDKDSTIPPTKANGSRRSFGMVTYEPGTQDTARLLAVEHRASSAIGLESSMAPEAGQLGKTRHVSLQRRREVCGAVANEKGFQPHREGRIELLIWALTSSRPRCIPSAWVFFNR